MDDKKRKRDERTNDKDGRCTFYNEKKRRSCRQLISPRVPEPFASDANFKPLYCGNHGSMYSNLLKSTKCLKVIHNDSKRGKRIPCPIDPSHMIYEKNLKSHMKKCPKAKQASEQRGASYYQHNINTGGFGKEPSASPTEGETKIDPKVFATCILKAYAKTFLSSSTSTSSDMDVTLLTEKEMYQAIPAQSHFESEKDLGLESVITKHRVKIGGQKHMEQIGSLVGHARKNELLENADTVLEMGAGRATTGFVLSGVCAAKKRKKVNLVLVERSGSRANADTALRRTHHVEEEKNTDDNADTADEEYFRAKDVQVHRIKCDLAHVNITEALDVAKGKRLICKEVNSDKEETLPKRNILVIAKHLCGAGTDIALKSIMPIRHRITGYILATCCHGVCDYKHYVGRDFLSKVMRMDVGDTETSFGEREFNLMRKWACGTVINGRRVLLNDPTDDEPAIGKDTDEEHAHSYNYDDDDFKEEISVTKISSAMGLKCGHRGLGRACQRLIDYGRCEYLRNELMGEHSGEVNLSHYVEDSVTPQNAMLFCKAL